LLAARSRELARFLSTFVAKEASLPEIRQKYGMDDDHRELVRRLFATATALIETAHEAAISGQSEAMTAEAYAAAARRLQGAARDIAALAEAATIIADPVKDGARTDPD
jgi:hypothetical protein